MNRPKAQPDYGNWVPKKLLILLWSQTVIWGCILIADAIFWHSTVLLVISGLACAILLVYALLMQGMHNAFSFTGGGVMGKIHQFLIEKLNWNGEGTLLDIGCGSGALSIRCAKAYPKAKVVGLDYWGVVWDYAQKQCEENAAAEGVCSVTFQKGDAAKLSFPDESVDAAVSNFVFHEVRTVRDKRALVKEALRVVKKGGSFAFHDLFQSKRLYGDMNQFVEELKASGITELHYEPHTENLPFIPGSIKLMFKDLGILYGKK